VRNGAKRHKTGCRTRLYATTGATRCPAFIPGILMDTLLRTASCGGENLVYRSNLSRRIAEMADPSTFKPILPPLPATFSLSFSGVKDAPARGNHFPHILWCKLPKLRNIIWFFFQKPIIRATPIINHLRDGFRESIIRLGVKVDNGLEKLNQGLKKAEKVKNSDQTSESNLRARYTLTMARGAR